MFATSPELGEELEAVEYEWEVLEPLVNEPPTTLIADAPANNSSQVMFEFTGTDDLTPPTRLVFECGLDTTNPVEFTECVSPFNVLELAGPEGLSAGQHTFAVRAVDETDPDGQPDPTPATYTWTHVLDTVAPQTVVLSGPPLRIIEETPAEITFTGTDNSTPAPPLDPEAVVPEFTLEFQCSLDGAGWTSCESPQDHTGLEPGVHALAVRAIDTRGNTDLSPAVHSWTVVGPPITTFTSTPPLSTASTTATFNWTTDQSPVTYTCTLNDAVVAPCAPGITITDLWGPDTDFTFEVTATNEFGLVEEQPASFTWAVQGPAGHDRTRHVDRRQAAGVDPQPARHVRVRLHPDRLDVPVRPRLHGLQLLRQPVGAARADHRSSTRCACAPSTRPATSTRPRRRTRWTVDGPPVTTITSFPAEDSTDSTATFAFTSSDAGSTFECFLDGVYEPCTSPKTYSGLTRGDHVFAVRATDPSGNLELAWQEHEWSIGIGVDFTQAPADPTDSTTATFAFASTVPGAAMLCSLDGAPALPCTSPRTYTNLTAGQHEFSVEVIDPQRLVDPLPIIYSWTIVDVTAPETTIAEGAAEPERERVADVPLHVQRGQHDVPVPPRQRQLVHAVPRAGDVRGPHVRAAHAARPRRRLGRPVRPHAGDVDTGASSPTSPHPDTSIDSGPPTVNADIEGIFAFSGIDEGTPPLELQFECRLDAGDWEQCDSPHEVQDLAPGAAHPARPRHRPRAEHRPDARHLHVGRPRPDQHDARLATSSSRPTRPSRRAAPSPSPPPSSRSRWSPSPGSTVMIELTSAPALPAGFMPAGAMYFDVRTTANYLGQPMICFEFEPSSFATPQAVRLLHYTGGGWTRRQLVGRPGQR